MADADAFEFSAPYVKLVDCRNTQHVTLCSFVPATEPRIDRIDDDKYFVRSTAEIRFYDHGETGTKKDHDRSVKRAFNNLKKLINCNYETPENVRFLTLTYAENMTDNARISDDWRRFLRRCKRCYGAFRWLYVKEQQSRGAWHLHCLFFFDSPAPWMDNSEVADMWGLGFVRVEAVRGDVNNLGNYLSAYMTDDKETGKKGARLKNYEAGIRLYNCSRDCLRPVVRVLSFEEYTDLIKGREAAKLSEHDRCVKLPCGPDLHIRYQMFRNV